MAERLKILFVCGKNQWRSPTAERIYANDPRLSVRSAGLSSKSAHQLSAQDLGWADLVLVMERKHVERIRSGFAMLEVLPPIECLEIPDEFGYMDPELVSLLRPATEHCIEVFRGGTSP